MSKYCSKCGAPIPIDETVCKVCGKEEISKASCTEGKEIEYKPVMASEKNSVPTSKANDKREGPNFFATDAGRWVVTLIAAIIIWGIAGTLWMQGSEISLVVILGCAIFGWQAINRHTPAFFLWMSSNAWIIYICVKGIISALIGLFVAPFVIGRSIGQAVQGTVQGYSDGKEE